jgi:hypothetical protein
VGQTINFNFQGVFQASTTNFNGVATVNYFAPNTPGVYTLQANFTGTNDCGPASGQGQVTVLGATPSSGAPTPTPALNSTSIAVANVTTTAGSLFLARATVQSPTEGCAFPDAVNLTFNGFTQTATTNLQGVATASFVAPNVQAVLPVTASFAGRGVCGPSNGSGNVTVFAAAPSPAPTGVSTPPPVPTPTLAPGQTPAPTPTPGPVPSGTVSLSTSGVSFSSQPVDTTSAPETITLLNGQNVPLNISSITITAAPGGVPSANGASDFTETDNCTPSVPASGSCNISVTFSPAVAGLEVATLQVHDALNATPHLALLHPQKVALAGRGVVPVTISAKKVVFGKVKVGKKTGVRKLSIANHLKVPVALTFTPSGSDFVMTNYTCGNSLQPKKSCRIGVAFQPGATGLLSGSVTVSDDANPVALIIQLTGRGK